MKLTKRKMLYLYEKQRCLVVLFLAHYKIVSNSLTKPMCFSSNIFWMQHPRQKFQHFHSMTNTITFNQQNR